jgi:hypothetical protein
MTTIEIRSTGFTKGAALLRDPLLNKGMALRPKNASAMGCAGLYGVDHFEENRRATIFVRKILKDAEPDDLPIEQAAKFQFIVNLNTAKALVMLRSGFCADRWPVGAKYDVLSTGLSIIVKGSAGTRAVGKTKGKARNTERRSYKYTVGD